MMHKMKEQEYAPQAEEWEDERPWIKIKEASIEALVFDGELVFDLPSHFYMNPGYMVRARVCPTLVWSNSRAAGLKLVAEIIKNVPLAPPPANYANCPYCVHGVGETEDCTCGSSGDEA